MKVIIDAYNVLHSKIDADKINKYEREAFINAVSAYAKRRQNEVIVVFDAGPSLFPTAEKYKGVTIMYSGPKDSADDIIVRYIKEHQGHSMVLVSSDRELAMAAEYYQVESVKADDFCTLLHARQHEETEPSEQTVKIADTTDEQVDALMQQTTVPMKIEDMQSPTEDRRSSAHKLSKKERKRLQKLKKL